MAAASTKATISAFDRKSGPAVKYLAPKTDVAVRVSGPKAMRASICSTRAQPIEASSILSDALADDVAEHQPILRRADKRRDEKAQRQRGQRVDTEPGRQRASVHAVHDKLAMREIENAHDAKPEAEADRQQAVDAAGEDAVDHSLCEGRRKGMKTYHYAPQATPDATSISAIGVLGCRLRLRGEH